MKNICNLIDLQTACIFLIFLIATVQISAECETQESEAGYTKHLTLYYFETYIICSYRVNLHLIVLNLYSVSINKIIVTEFITVKVSQNLNLM